MKKILYFGLFDPDFCRNKVYSQGLMENGYTVLLCSDQALGLKKYWNLFKKHWLLRKEYDVMVVGYPGYAIVPFARLISRKKIVFDALCSFYETEILSQRSAQHKSQFKRMTTRCIDWLATRCADIVLVETDKQKKYFIEKLGVKKEKLVTVYTGVDESVFFLDTAVEKYDTFTVLFRGRITNEAGAEYVLRAAKILENQGINFLVIGFGWSTDIKRFNEVYKELKPSNVRHVDKYVTNAEMRLMTQRCHVSIGQVSEHGRLSRTIPHKAFEALVMKLPYVTARSEGISEILQEGKHCLMIRPVDAEDLAEKILLLKNDAVLQERLAEEGYQLFNERFTASKIVQPLLGVIE